MIDCFGELAVEAAGYNTALTLEIMPFSNVRSVGMAKQIVDWQPVWGLGRSWLVVVFGTEAVTLGFFLLSRSSLSVFVLSSLHFLYRFFLYIRGRGFESHGPSRSFLQRQPVQPAHRGLERVQSDQFA